MDRTGGIMYADYIEVGGTVLSENLQIYFTEHFGIVTSSKCSGERRTG